MSDQEEFAAISARVQLLQDNLAEAVRLAEAFYAGQAEAQKAAQQAIKEKTELEQRIQTLLNEKSDAAEKTEDHFDAAPLLAEREALQKRIHELENNLAEAQNSLEIRLKEVNDFQDRIDRALAEKAEVENLRQGLWDENVRVQNELVNLETRVESECNALKDKIQALEINLHTAESLAETAQRDKRAADEKIETITVEKTTIENRFEDAVMGKVDAEKELLAAIKINETLTIQLEACNKRLHRPIIKVAMAVVLLLAMALLGYSIFLFQGYPNRLVNVDRQLETLVTRFEDKTQLFDVISQSQKQMAAKLDEIYQEVEIIGKKAGIQIVAPGSEKNPSDAGFSGLADRIDRLEKALNDLPTGRIGWQEEVDALRKKVADLEKQRKQLEIEKAKSFLPEDRHFKILTEVYFDSGETKLSEKAAEKIKVIAEKIKNKPEIPIRIEGHSDDKPLRWTIFDRFSNNMELSIDRGATVAGILIKAGIDARQISIIGIGPARPVSSNDSSEGRAKNRRVEIKIMDNQNNLG
jgi:flagellar motor protein MotB